MKMHKSIKADAAGRINLGKRCADRLFTISEENGKIVLEPACIVPEREMRSHEKIINILLGKKEWSTFQNIMTSDDDPNDNLRRLMKNPE